VRWAQTVFITDASEKRQAGRKFVDILIQPHEISTPN